MRLPARLRHPRARPQSRTRATLTSVCAPSHRQ
jgi:hypothetical protein